MLIKVTLENGLLQAIETAAPAVVQVVDLETKAAAICRTGGANVPTIFAQRRSTVSAYH